MIFNQFISSLHSQEDIEKFKEEMVKRQSQQGAQNNSGAVEAIEEKKTEKSEEKQLADIPIDDDDSPSSSVKDTKDEDLEAGR